MGWATKELGLNSECRHEIFVSSKCPG